MKQRGEKIAALTAYDYPMTKLLDEAGVPLILVGDSLGMVVLGYPDTTHVTLAEMEHHVRAAARAKPQALLGADLPYRSYETPEQAVANAKRLVAAGADKNRSISPPSHGRSSTFPVPATRSSLRLPWPSRRVRHRSRRRSFPITRRASSSAKSAPPPPRRRN